MMMMMHNGEDTKVQDADRITTYSLWSDIAFIKCFDKNKA